MNKIGIDIIQIKRIKLKKEMIIAILNINEMKYFEKIINNEAKKQFLAGRWAAKEAILKVIDQKIAPKNIDINYLNDKPVITNEKLKHIQISISHEKDYAVAVALNL